MTLANLRQRWEQERGRVGLEKLDTKPRWLEVISEEIWRIVTSRLTNLKWEPFLGVEGDWVCPIIYQYRRFSTGLYEFDILVPQILSPQDNLDELLAQAERDVQAERWQSALNNYQRVLELDPDNPTAQDALFRLYLRLAEDAIVMHQFSKAKQHLDNAETIRLGPEEIKRLSRKREAYLLLVQAEEDAQAERWQNARDNYQRVLELDPDNPTAQDALFRLYLQLADDAIAMRQFSNANQHLDNAETIRPGSEEIKRLNRKLEPLADEVAGVARVEEPAVESPAVPKTVRIFLASSKELKEDRDAFDLYFRQQNDYLRKQGLYLEIIRWENFIDAMSGTRLQDEYNDAIRQCDIFVSLFSTTAGKYTEEEFDVAFQTYKATKKRPKVYTFFKHAPIDPDADREALMSLWAFQDKLKQLGHFYTKYNDIEHLKLQFSNQLQKLRETDKLPTS